MKIKRGVSISIAVMGAIILLGTAGADESLADTQLFIQLITGFAFLGIGCIGYQLNKRKKVRRRGEPSMRTNENLHLDYIPKTKLCQMGDEK